MQNFNEPVSAVGPWRSLREPYDQNLSEPRAICLRDGNNLRIATLPSNYEHGFSWCTKQFSAAFHRPDLTLRFSPWIYGNTRGLGGPGPHSLDFNPPRFTRGALGPDVIERDLIYNNVGLKVYEELLRTTEETYIWNMVWHRNAYRPYSPNLFPQEKPLPFVFHLLVESRELLNVSCENQNIILDFGTDGDLFGFRVDAIGARWGKPLLLEEHKLEEAVVSADTLFNAGPLLELPTRLRKFSLPLFFDLLPDDAANVTIKAGFKSAKNKFSFHNDSVKKARLEIESNWNQWMAAVGPGPQTENICTLQEQLAGRASSKPRSTYRDRHGVDRLQYVAPVRPLPQLIPKDLTQAWKKCLALTRLCERIDPIWGRTLTESFTCWYNGTFVWSVPVVGWYARKHPDPQWKGMLKDVLVAYIDNVAKDGGFPCYIPFNAAKPENPPEHHAFTQLPQIAWSVWQEYRFNRDTDWLRRFLCPLIRFSDYMDSRDKLGLGLWCQHHYYDGLDMFPTVDGLVLRKETVLYSASYAAEQVQYLRALSLIMTALGERSDKEYKEKAESAHSRMIGLLWDEKRQWFGDILADGNRETVVGMQGLFALAYGLAPDNCEMEKLGGNLESLIAPFGVCTVAPEDERYCEQFFWRGPAWPASCLYGTAAARVYAPHLLPRMGAATVRLALAQPNIWECLQPHSGQTAFYDEGHGVIAGLSSVVGSYAICAALEIAYSSSDPFAL